MVMVVPWSFTGPRCGSCRCGCRGSSMTKVVVVVVVVEGIVPLE